MIRELLAVHGNWVLSSEEVDDLKRLLDDGESLGLLTGVPSVEHEGASKTLDCWAESLGELLALVPTQMIMGDCIPSSSVGDKHLSSGCVDGDVILEARIDGFHLIVIPSAEKARFVGKLYPVSCLLLCVLFIVSHAKDYFL